LPRPLADIASGTVLPELHLIRFLSRKSPQLAAQHDNVSHFAQACASALPVLTEHIDISQRQIEGATASLGEKFVAIVSRLDSTLAVSSDMAGDTDGGLVGTLAVGKRQLQEVVAGLKEINASRNGLTCESNIAEVLSRFGASSRHLSDSTARLRAESETIKDELQASIVDPQFQDRVSQILSHAAQSLRQLSSHADGHDQLSAADVAALLEKIVASYTTEEQRRAHGSESVAVATVPSEVTFF
jgi:hypothetical protein